MSNLKGAIIFQVKPARGTDFLLMKNFFFRLFNNVIRFLLCIYLLYWLLLFAGELLFDIEQAAIRSRFKFNLKKYKAQLPEVVLIFKDFPELLPREKWAEVIHNLRLLGAKVIALDFEFAGAKDKASDDILIKKILEKNDTILGIRTYESTDEKGGKIRKATNLFGLATHTFNVGSLQVTTGPGGMVQSLPLFIKFNNKYIPSISLAMFSLQGKFEEELKSKLRDDYIDKAIKEGKFSLGKNNFPLQGSELFFNFFSHPHPPVGGKAEYKPWFDAYSVKDLLDKKKVSGWLADKNSEDPQANCPFDGMAVLVGSRDLTEHDYFRTPAANMTFGMELHANSLESMHKKRFPQKLSYFKSAPGILY
ncbi:CHASE2 domain-containing protein, partial [Candidatus Riflebacteria bacterium]